MIKVKEELQPVKKNGLTINAYMLKIMLLADELKGGRCGLFKEKKLMSILGI